MHPEHHHRDQGWHRDVTRWRIGSIGPVPELDLVNPATYSSLTGRSPFAVRQSILNGELATARIGGRLLVRLPRRKVKS